MDKAQLLDRTQQALKPFETEKVLVFMKNLSTQTVTENPRVTFLLFLVFLYALWRWSRIVLLFLFTFLSFTMLVRYTLPAPGTALTINTTFPFAMGSLGIGAVLLYFIFIKTE